MFMCMYIDCVHLTLNKIVYIFSNFILNTGMDELFI
jgi:hypothetical protein